MERCRDGGELQWVLEQGGEGGRCWGVRSSEQGPLVGLTVLLVVSLLTMKSDRHEMVDKVKKGG